MATRRTLINIDEQLDIEISNIVKTWSDNGFKNVKKPDVLRLLIKKYKEQLIFPVRKKKSKKWEIL